MERQNKRFTMCKLQAISGIRGCDQRMVLAIRLNEGIQFPQRFPQYSEPAGLLSFTSAAPLPAKNARFSGLYPAVTADRCRSNRMGPAQQPNGEKEERAQQR